MTDIFYTRFTFIYSILCTYYTPNSVVLVNCQRLQGAFADAAYLYSLRIAMLTHFRPLLLF